MVGVQRFFANNNNALRDAILTASGVKPAAAIFRSSINRTGNGTVKLTGSYSGAEDASFDIEITSDTSATPRVSSPVFSGVGNGQLQSLTVDPGTSAEVFTISLADLGSDTTAAQAGLGSVSLQAKMSGSSGNSINITVDESGLVYTDTDYAALDNWSTGQTYRLGDQWDFGAKPLQADGALDPSSPRIVFGDDPQVYRQYKKREEGQWRYYVTPALVRDVPEGARIKAVTGNRSVTITDGVTPETYNTIVTTYDLLAAIRSSSALVDVVGVISNDRQPGGQAVIDLPLKTVSYALPVVTSGSKYATGLSNLVVDTGAPTEAVLITCADNATIGSERWNVEGTVSGKLLQAISGVDYESSIVNFRIPTKSPEVKPSANVSWDTAYETREDAEVSPPICVSNFTLGANASGKSITFTYKQRPNDDDCACSKAAVSGRISAACLGIDEEAVMATLDPEYKSRLQTLYDWRSTFMQENTFIGNDSVGGTTLDRQLIESVTTVFAEALYLFFGDATARAAWDAAFSAMQNELADFTGSETQWVEGWQASNAYSQGWIIPSEANDNGHVYILVDGDGGNSGATEPVWPVNGTTVVDGALTWRDAGLRSDSGLTEFDTGTKYNDWSASEVLSSLSTTYRKPSSANDNGHYYRSFTGTCSATEPTWPTDGGSVVDGSVTWVDMGLRGGFYNIGTVVQPTEANANGHAYIALNSGTSGGVEPAWPVDGSTIKQAFSEVTWLDLGYWRQMGVTQEAVQDLNPSVTDVGEFITRYSAKMDALGIGLGIVPGKADGSSVGGAACWSDPGDGFAWMAPGYLPAFTNRAWHSAKRNLDGDIESTREFALAIKCACPEHLKEGDSITITIDGVTGGGKAYQVGDSFRVPVINASALFLAGGVDGDDTHTWSVTGNVSGNMADYAVVDAAELPYSAGGIGFTIYRGGIPFSLGDQFQFAVEGGQYRWRKDAAAWSAAADIPDTPVLLSDGVSADFQAGAAPSYVAGDSHSFLARQPYAPSHVQTPQDETWQWDGAGATLTANLGGAQNIDAFVLARHTLPEGAVITVEGGQDGVAWPESVVLTWRDGVMAELLPSSWNVEWLRLTVANASGGAIGWWWAGPPVSTEYSAGKVSLRRNYAITRGGGLNPSGLFAGKGQGGEISWSTFLSQTDLDKLLLMLDHVKVNDEPIVVLPHQDHPQEAALVSIEVDDVDIDDDYQFQPDDRNNRLLSLRLPLAAVLS